MEPKPEQTVHSEDTPEAAEVPGKAPPSDASPLAGQESELHQGEAPQKASPSDARSLVQEMVASGEWPDPKLLERILATGQEAALPLIEVIESRSVGWPEEAAVQVAAGLLCTIGSTAAMPALKEAIRFYQGDAGIYIADEMFRLGTAGLELLLEIIGDSSLETDHRLAIIESAQVAAGSDLSKRAQVAEVVRAWFTSLASEIEAQPEAGSEIEPSQDDLAADTADEVGGEVEDRGHDQDDAEIEDQGEEQDEGVIEEIDDIDLPTVDEDEELPEEWDDDDLDYDDSDDQDNDPTSTLAELAYDLAALGDEFARPMIEEAFSKDLIDISVVDRDDIESLYADSGEKLSAGTESWLENYRGFYDGEMNRRKRLAELPEYEFPARSSYPSFDLTQPVAPPEELPPIEPIRNVAPRIGRNDPCWCGSGKKYKKCHLGKDAPA